MSDTHRVTGAVDDQRGFPDVEIQSAQGYPAARTPADHPEIKLLTDSGREIYPEGIVIIPSSPASRPMSLLSSEAPVLSIGVGHADSNIHAPNESIFLEDLYRGAKHVATFLVAYGENHGNH